MLKNVHHISAGFLTLLHFWVHGTCALARPSSQFRASRDRDFLWPTSYWLPTHMHVMKWHIWVLNFLNVIWPIGSNDEWILIIWECFWCAFWAMVQHIYHAWWCTSVEVIIGPTTTFSSTSQMLGTKGVFLTSLWHSWAMDMAELWGRSY